MIELTKKQKKPSKTSANEKLARAVCSKIDEGDIRGSVRLLTSDCGIAGNDETTLKLLQEKQLPAPSDRRLFPDANCDPLSLTVDDIRKGVMSFQPGSAAGITGLRPQHLKDCLGKGEDIEQFLRTLTTFCNLLLAGNVPRNIKPIIAGANLCALAKKEGGIRPIASGDVLRRLTAKCAAKIAAKRHTKLFLPHQLGCGVMGGAEAAAHALRKFVEDASNGTVLLKLDFKNAFNSIRRDVVAEKLHEHMPELSSFFDLCFSETTYLSFGEFLIDSSEGAQKGDPLAVFLFCLAINNILQTLISNFKSGYVDDISIGDVMWQNVLKDLEMVMTEGVKIGMELNLKNKSELIVFCDDARERDSIIQSFLAVFHITITEPTDLVLLGAPIGENAQEAVVNEKLDELSRMCIRLRSLPSHVAFFLLKNCFYIPKLMYILRTSTLFLKTTSLHRFDECIRNTLQAIFNVMIDDPRWELMTLPCKLGGMGIMQVPKLAIAAYASSVFSTLDICNTIYASEPTTESLIQDAIQRWRNNVSTDVPLPERKYKQKKWSLPMMLQQAELLKDSGDSNRLNGLMCPGAADWLNALPSRSLALQLSDDEFRIAIGFRLGAPVCTPHKCSCGDIVDSYGKHALVCKKSRSVHA